MSKSDPFPGKDQVTFAEELNSFFTRFDKHDFSQERLDLKDQLISSLPPSDSDIEEIEEETVAKIFKGLNARKATGPDGLSCRLLKTCSDQLSRIFCFLFNWSLKDATVPTLWKTSIVCPVPKVAKPSILNDFRPNALTCVPMKCLEKCVLSRIKNQTSHVTDPLQFAYKHNRGTNDAIITLLDHVYFHLEKPLSYARILYADFSSAFNTVQPHLMAKKLISLGVESRLNLWILDFLVNRTQFVKCHSVETGRTVFSSSRVTCTGTPQGTVVSPVIFTLYTDDCRSRMANIDLIKYSDDTALVDCTNNDTDYQQAISDFSKWCDDNFLDFNVGKTKEMVIDFRTSNQTDIPTLTIGGADVERVQEYKYLGTIIDNKLNFNSNTDLINSKCQQRLYFLRKLRSLDVSTSVLRTFYCSFIESVLTCSFICFYGGLSVQNKNKLNKVVNVSSKIVNERLSGLNELYERRVRAKAVKIESDTSHILASRYELLPSGRRFRTPKFKTIRTQKSFIPMSISLLNAN